MNSPYTSLLFCIKKFSLVLLFYFLFFIFIISNSSASIPFPVESFTYHAIDSVFVPSINSIFAQGRNISNVSFNQRVQSNNWHVFYGLVSNQYFLSDNSSHIVFTRSNVFGKSDTVLFFSNSSDVNWSSLRASNSSDLTDEDNSLSLTGRVDSVTNTLTLKSHNQISNFDGLGNSIFANSAYNLNSTSFTYGAVWSTILLRAGVLASSPAIYATIQRPGSPYTSYNNIIVDFQAMIPVDSMINSRTYYVYFQMN